MAYNETKTDYDVQPTWNEDGTLSGVRLIRSQRTVRKAEDGRVLDRGYTGRDYAEQEMEIPISRLADIISELVSWPVYYATGQAARDQRDPVAWPNSTATVEVTG